MAINWSPDAEDEVRQNVDTIVRTERGSVPGFRSFGTPQDLVDSAQTVAAAKIKADVVDAIRRFEPRVDARTVRLAGSSDGTLTTTYRVVKP